MLFVVQSRIQEGGGFVPIKLENIPRNQFNELVLNGAMGVDKSQEIEGVAHLFLRLIRIFNIY